MINTTDGVGVVDGRFRIDVSGGRDTFANYAAVYGGGNIAGLGVRRRARSGRAAARQPLSGFNPTSGFTGGKIGGGTAGGGAVELSGAKCASNKTKPEKSEARGTVSALNATSITVAGLTCAINPNDSAAVNAKLHVNDRAEIHCSLAERREHARSLEQQGEPLAPEFGQRGGARRGGRTPPRCSVTCSSASRCR